MAPSRKKEKRNPKGKNPKEKKEKKMAKEKKSTVIAVVAALVVVALVLLVFVQPMMMSGSGSGRVLLVASDVLAQAGGAEKFATYLSDKSVSVVAYNYDRVATYGELGDLVRAHMESKGASRARSVGIMYHTPNRYNLQCFASDPAKSTVDGSVESFESFRRFVVALRAAYGVEDVDLISCDVVSAGTSVLSALDYNGARVNASTNITGQVKQGPIGDWVLESGNVNLIGRYFNAEITKIDLALPGPGPRPPRAPPGMVPATEWVNGIAFSVPGKYVPAPPPKQTPPPPPPPVRLPNRLIPVFFQAVSTTENTPICVYKVEFMFYDINTMWTLQDKLLKLPLFAEYLAVLKTFTRGINQTEVQPSFRETPGSNNAFYNLTYSPNYFLCVTMSYPLQSGQASNWFNVRALSNSELQTYNSSADYWKRESAAARASNRGSPVTFSQLQSISSHWGAPPTPQSEKLKPNWFLSFIGRA